MLRQLSLFGAVCMVLVALLNYEYIHAVAQIPVASVRFSVIIVILMWSWLFFILLDYGLEGDKHERRRRKE